MERMMKRRQSELLLLSCNHDIHADIAKPTIALCTHTLICICIHIYTYTCTAFTCFEPESLVESAFALFGFLEPILILSLPTREDSCLCFLSCFSNGRRTRQRVCVCALVRERERQGDPVRTLSSILPTYIYTHTHAHTRTHRREVRVLFHFGVLPCGRDAVGFLQ